MKGQTESPAFARGFRHCAENATETLVQNIQGAVAHFLENQPIFCMVLIWFDPFDRIKTYQAAALFRPAG
ncbi:hypothetical protein MSS88_08000 [bacterium]|uniref:hypothetical protein n=1 Tax=Gemmiger sp. TaxID=2049027 RepID=UPI002A80FD6D|nr:hypothetical protein [Gemmiger sp.]MCI6177026.1 hypothetical protein [bacterium]MCI6521130.1 hypothetical protein [bacterium]MCI6885210.1 hypothetical protein [bacterium]MCI7325412.1 hypothetical protein [bacterium]MCI7744727.1 hypothetical protein [bacterium]